MEIQISGPPEVRSFLEEIVEEMQRLFGISRDEAVGRMNRDWAEQDFRGKDPLILHETPSYWAHNIYYGPNARWWDPSQKLRPIPYP